MRDSMDRGRAGTLARRRSPFPSPQAAPAASSPELMADSAPWPPYAVFGLGALAARLLPLLLKLPSLTLAHDWLALMYDPRSSERALLNLELPRTAWMNFGWWGGAGGAGGGGFAAAAAELARRVGRAAALTAADECLDCGCGCGDQDLLWRAEFGVLRIEALDPVASQVAAAQRRVRDAGLADVIGVRCAAVGGGRALPFSDGSFTRVLSVDSAYHFDTRRRFFGEARRVLRPGGALALADIVLARPWAELSLSQAAAVRVVCALMSVPIANVCTAEEYARQLEQAGFAGVRCESFSHAVVPGFCAFVGEHSDGVEGELGLGQRKLRSVASLISSGVVQKVVDFVLVSAKRPL